MNDTLQLVVVSIVAMGGLAALTRPLWMKKEPARPASEPPCAKCASSDAHAAPIATPRGTRSGRL